MTAERDGLFIEVHEKDLMTLREYAAQYNKHCGTSINWRGALDRLLTEARVQTLEWDALAPKQEQESLRL